MMAVVRNMIELIVNPFFLCFLVLGFGTWFLWRSKYAVFVRVAMSTVCIVLFLMSTGWLPRYLTNKLERQYPVVAEVDPNIRWVVVFSGGQTEVAGMPANALLSSASIKRLVEGLRLFRALPHAQLVLSGGGYSHQQSEAKQLAKLTEWFSIPEQAVVLEENSINTADEAREIISIVHDQPFYLVTSAIHMPRAMLLCQQSGLHPIAAPTDFTFFWNDERVAKRIIPNPYNMTYFTIALHELLGRVWMSRN